MAVVHMDNSSTLACCFWSRLIAGKPTVKALPQGFVLLNLLEHEALTELWEVVVWQVEGLRHPGRQFGARGLVSLPAEHPGEMPVVDAGGPCEGSKAHLSLGQEIGDLFDEGAHRPLAFHAREYPAPCGRSPGTETMKPECRSRPDSPHTGAMSTTARHARNDRIVQLRARGLTMKQIADEVGVSERHCARILEERMRPSRSSTSLPAQATGTSSATATELLDRLQGTVGDLAETARVQAGRYNVGGVLRIEILHNMAECAIEELRRRTAQLAPANPTEEGGSPPSRDGHVMTQCVRS